jgi:hypothetical protein
MIVWKQCTTGKIHRKKTCGINSRTRYAHAAVEMTLEEIASSPHLCQKCFVLDRAARSV